MSDYAPFVGAPPLQGLDDVPWLPLGDSLTVDPRFRRAVDRTLRQSTHVFRATGNLGLGAATGGIIGSTDLFSWEHGAVTGNTQAQITARVPALAVALTGSRRPRVIVDTSGTNDVSAQRPLADILADKRALHTALRTHFPGVPRVMNSIPTWRSGSASGASWAQKRALRNDVCAALPALARELSAVFVDGYGGQPPQEIGPDGTHPGPDEAGYRRAGHRVGRTLLELAGLPWGRRRPLVATPRPAQAALAFSGVNARGTWPANAAFAPEQAPRWAMTVWVVVTALPVGAPVSVVGIGGSHLTGVNLAIEASGWNFYMGSNTAIFAGNTPTAYAYNRVQLETPMQVGVVCDRVEGKVGFIINGEVVINSVDLAEVGHPALNWNIPASTLYAGDFVLDNFQGKLKELAFYKGPGAPGIHEIGRFAEEIYADGIFWSGLGGDDETALSALYRLDEGVGAPAEAAGVTAAGTMTSPAAWTTWEA